MEATTKTNSKGLTGYFFEIYTTGPAGESAWDNACFHVMGAESMEQAVAKVKSVWGKNLDQIITADYRCIDSSCTLPRVEA